MPTVSLCMIVRDVADRIESCLGSVAGLVDELVIVDTGSTDQTKSLILRTFPKARIFDFTERTNPESFLLDTSSTWGGEIPGPFTEKKFLANFGAARQLGWEQATGDFKFWLDSDDRLAEPESFKKALQELQESGADTAMLPYEYSFDDKGRPTCTQFRERIVRRGKGRWEQKIHELLICDSFVTLKSPKVIHDRHKYKSNNVASRNLKVLWHWWRVNRDDLKNADARLLFYTATEAQWHWPDKALEVFKAYFAKSGWDAERGVAHMSAGRIHENAGRLDQALGEYAQAALDSSDCPDGHFALARVLARFAVDGNFSYWHKVIEHVKTGLATMERTKDHAEIMFHDPADRRLRPFEVLSQAYGNLGQYQECLEAAEKGLEYDPNHGNLKHNRDFAKRSLEEQKKPKGVKLGELRADAIDKPARDLPTDVLGEFILQLWKKLRDTGHRENAEKLLRLLPPELAGYDRLKTAKLSPPAKSQEPSEKASSGLAVLEKPVASSRAPQDIVIWTGWAWEPWSPKSLETGIGGSETAAICMARELAKRGHRVRVIGNCEGMEGNYDGVVYLHWEKHKRVQADVIVVSRSAEVLVNPDFEFQARTKVVWVHDIHCGQHPAALEGLKKADKIFCLSKWHRDFFLSTYPSLDPAKVIQTRNGIDVERFLPNEDVFRRKKNRLIYSSSPDRGLARLLELFPKIRAQVPDAELHVFYGFYNWKESAKVRGDGNMLADIERLERTVVFSDGISYHGRVGQLELAQAFLDAKVWAYPTWFTETSCITAMEAQAAGCVPVTTALAALNETVKNGFLIMPPETSDEYGRSFVDYCVDVLLKGREGKEEATRGRARAMRECSWSGVAEQWEWEFAEAKAPAFLKNVPEVSVCVAMSRPGGVDITLAAMRDQTFKNFELVIADNRYEQRHSRLLAMANRYGIKNVVHVPEHRRNGKWIVAVAGYNTMFAAARGKYVLILHDFAYAPPGWIESHLEVLSKYGKVLSLGDHRNVDLPALKNVVADQTATDRAVVADDPGFQGHDELAIFERGEFDSGWLPLPISDKQWQPHFSSSFHEGLNNDPRCISLTNDGVSREFLCALNGVDERYDKGRGPWDWDLGRRISTAGGQFYFSPRNLVSLLNPRFVMRSKPFGDHTQSIDGRWTSQDGQEYLRRVMESGDVRAKNPFDLWQLSQAAETWRDGKVECVPRDVPDREYYGADILPATPELSPASVTLNVRPRMPKVTVLVLMYRPGGVDIVLEGLAGQTFKDFEVVIVDNRYEKRHARVLEEAAKRGLDVVHVPEHRRNGKWIVACAAFNTGLALARGEYVAVISDFSFLPPEWLERAMAHAGPDKHVTLPYRHVDLPGDYDSSRDRSIPVLTEVSEAGGLDEIYGPSRFDRAWLDLPDSARVVNGVLWKDHRPCEDIAEVDERFLFMRFELFPRKLAFEVNGVDERYNRGRGPWDWDFGVRVRNAGAKIVWAGKSAPPALYFNPHWLSWSKPFGGLNERVDGRWCDADGNAYLDFQRSRKATKARNPVTLHALAEKLSAWRNPDEICEPSDVSDRAYFGKDVWPETE